MSRTLKVLVTTALLSLGAFTFSAGGAQAHTIDCTLTGSAEADPPVQSVLTDIADGGPVTFATDFDTGNYTFTADATCAVSRTGPVSAGVEFARITSSGDYRNRVCGTGFVESTPGEAGDPDPDATLIDFSNPAVDDVTNVDYEIEFVAANGALVIDSAIAGGHPLSGGGFAQIRPSEGNCVAVDVSQFDVAGSFSVTGP